MHSGESDLIKGCKWQENYAEMLCMVYSVCLGDLFWLLGFCVVFFVCLFDLIFEWSSEAQKNTSFKVFFFHRQYQITCPILNMFALPSAKMM